MHHFRRRSHLILHLFNAISWLLMLFLALVTIGLLVAAFLTYDRLLALAGLTFASATLIVALLQRLGAGSANCPLCRMPPLGSRACQKNAKARPFLGSYRLRVSLSTVLLNRFRCPYCGEPTRCSVKLRQAPEPSEDSHPNAFLNPFR